MLGSGVTRHSPLFAPCRHPYDQHASDAPGAAIGIRSFTAGRNLRNETVSSRIGMQPGYSFATNRYRYCNTEPRPAQLILSLEGISYETAQGAAGS
jgi:hypothetical protein